MEIDPLDFRIALDMPPDEAIVYLKSKGYVITSSWDELLGQARNQAFTVAGIFRADLLVAMQDELVEALGEGKPLEQFKKDARAALLSKGLYNVEDLTTEQGEKQRNVIESHRLENIFRTNTLSALNAGRQLRQDAMGDARPWRRINFVNDKRQSPTCKSLQAKLAGYVIHYQHPEIGKLTPPFHYQCRDTVSALSERERVRMALKIYKGATGWEPMKGFEQSPADGFTPDISKYPPELQKQFRDFLKQRNRS